MKNFKDFIKERSENKKSYDTIIEEDKLNESSIKKINYAKEDVLFDMSIKEIAANAFDIAKPKMLKVSKNAQARDSRRYLGTKNFLNDAIEELAIEVTKSTFDKIYKEFMKEFKNNIATNGIYKNPLVKIL